jgi:hypothetical protein
MLYNGIAVDRKVETAVLRAEVGPSAGPAARDAGPSPRR